VAETVQARFAGRPADRLRGVVPRAVVVATAAAAAGVAAGWIRVGGFGTCLAVLAVLDTVATATLWRVDRRQRARRGRVTATENLGYLAVHGAVVLATAVALPSWITPSCAWYWYGAGLVLGVALIRAGGMRIGALRSGELAFLAGPKPVGLAVVTCALLAAGAVAEEILYRGATLAHAGAVVVVAATAAFVGRHHLPGWATRRANVRTVAVETGSALGFLALTVFSHSLYPAILAHLVNNTPSFVLTVQRATAEGDG
jgi:membrane protease YdiL (CAAX protease family)